MIFLSSPEEKRSVLGRDDVTVFAQKGWTKTLAKYGCTTTVIASIINDAGYDMNPGLLEHQLRKKGMYDRRGRMYGLRPGASRHIDSVVPVIRFTGRVSGTHQQVKLKVQQRLSRGEYVALKISRKGGEHWVRAYSAENGDLRIMDPAGGRVGFLSSLYGVRVIREAVFFGLAPS